MKGKSIKIITVIVSLAPTASAQQQVSLREALELAGRNNRNIQVQQIEAQKAEYQLREAKANFLPMTSANGSYSYFFQQPVIFMRNPDKAINEVADVTVGGKNAINGFVTVVQPILSAKAVQDIRVANRTKAIETENFDQLKDDVQLQVAKQYLRIVLYNKQIVLLQQSLLRNEKALFDSRNLFLLGKALKSDTLNTYIAVQNVKSTISALRTELEISELQMTRLLGKDGRIYEYADTSLLSEVKLPSLSAEELISQAIANRNDLRALSHWVQLGKQQEKLVAAFKKPTLNAVGQYQIQAQADRFSSGLQNTPATSFAGIQLTVPIYAGGRFNQKQSVQRAATLQHQLRYDDKVSLIRTEITALLERLRDAHSQRKIMTQNVQAAEISFRMMFERYSNGLSSRLDLSDAELTLTKARNDLLLAEYRIRTLEFEILHASGQQL